MPDKWIPNGETDFLQCAEKFAKTLAADPQRYFIQPGDVKLLTRRLNEFHVARRQIDDAGRTITPSAIEKKDARLRVERLMRKLANLIRPNEEISTADKVALNIKPRARKQTKQKCPRRAPELTFVGFANENSLDGRRHVLRFKDPLGAGTSPATMVTIKNLPLFSRSRAKPEGAVRLELFFEWVAAGQEVPKHPAGLSGWPRYLRSYTRTPIEVEFPMPPTPMVIVYWARWADSRGNVGPFSQPVVAGWESRAQLPGKIAGESPMLPRQQKVVIISPRRELPQELEVIETNALPMHESELRQLEAPRESEAA
jgi:hypothetical protein